MDISTTMQMWARSRPIPLTPSGHKTPIRAVLSAYKRQSLQMLIWQIPWWSGPGGSWQVRLMLGALRRSGRGTTDAI